MASVKTYTDKIRKARYGKEVRSSIADSIDIINEESEASVKKVNQAEANVNKAVTDAINATNAANTAASTATTAANNANEAAQAIFDENYILTARTEFAKSARVSPTAKGNAILEKLRGDSWQKQLIGKNLFDISKALVGRIDSNGDYAVGGITSTFYEYDWKENTQYSFSGYVKNDVRAGNVRLTVYYADDTVDTNVLINNTTEYKYVSFTSAMNKTVSKVSVNYGSAGTMYIRRGELQIEEGVATEYEPYCGNTPSPNPSYEQKVRSVGDMGWFDGELRQGTYGEGGNYIAGDGTSVCNVTSIPCKGGDLIAILRDVNATPLIHWWGDNGFISGQSALSGVTAPSDATHFDFVLYSSAGITPSTVGHVCVTINGKYALIVDEGNKNLLPFKERYTNNSTIDLRSNFHFKMQIMYTDGTLAVAKNTNVAITKAGIVEFPINLDRDVSLIKLMHNGSHNDITFDSITCNIPSGDYVISFNVDKYDPTVIGGIEFHDIQLERNSKASPCVPHQSTRHYIPLDEPLRGIRDVKDEIVCQNGIYGVLRRVGEFVLRNITDIAHTGTSGTARCIISIPDKIYKETGAILCDRAVSGNDKAHCFWENPANIILRGDVSDDLETFKAKYEGTVFVYQLAEPVFTPFADQTPFYNFKSYDEVTHVSIVGHEELNPMATIRFPRNEDGALETTNHCEKQLLKIENKAIRAEIEELTAALLALGRE